MKTPSTRTFGKMIHPFIFGRQEVDGVTKLIPFWLWFDRENLVGQHSLRKLTNWQEADMVKVNAGGEEYLMPLVDSIQQRPEDVEMTVPFGDGTLKTFAPPDLNLSDVLKMLTVSKFA